MGQTIQLGGDSFGVFCLLLAVVPGCDLGEHPVSPQPHWVATSHPQHLSEQHNAPETPNPSKTLSKTHPSFTLHPRQPQAALIASADLTSWKLYKKGWPQPKTPTGFQQVLEPGSREPARGGSSRHLRALLQAHQLGPSTISTKSYFPAMLGLCQRQKGGREEQEILSIPVGCCKPPLFGVHSPFLAPDVVLLHRVAKIGVLRARYDFGPLGVDVEGVAEPWGERRRIPSGRVLRCWGKALLWCGRPDPTGVILRGAEPPSTGPFMLFWAQKSPKKPPAPTFP